jgi:hypothetical protein
MKKNIIKITEDDFIADYLNEKMKNHNLPFGNTYFTLLEKHSENARKEYNKLKIEKK